MGRVQARVEADDGASGLVLEADARVGERGLGRGVVLLVEGKDDLVTGDCVLYFRVNIRAFRVFEAINSQWLLG